ncbi:unnamed protein product [Cuscuta europaea]|uniref:Uncharacterized protein n=1 Tax=Cuscuta europaea TaxID=41803 RepID=A0A9P1EKC0_CUSEU|nr:unnamed protein product [Cuscuta europaea]
MRIADSPAGSSPVAPLSSSTVVDTATMAPSISMVSPTSFPMAFSLPSPALGSDDFAATSGFRIHPGLQFPQQVNSYRLFSNMLDSFPASSFLPQYVPSSSAPTFPTLSGVSSQTVFSGPTISRQSGVAPLPPHQTQHMLGFSSPTTFLASLASHMAFSTPNVTNIVTTRLNVVEDYLPWRTQFESFLVSHSLLGLLYVFVLTPPQFIHDTTRREMPNPEYHHWLKIDQTIRSWLFVTLSRDILMEVHDLKVSIRIWECLETRFMSACLARSLELKRLLSHIKKK